MSPSRHVTRAPSATDWIAPWMQMCEIACTAHFKGTVDRLHARRELREMVVTEIGLARPGRDDQAVVRRLIAQTERL